MTVSPREDAAAPLARVLFWAESFWPLIGGTETRSAVLLPKLRDRGFEYTVITDLRGTDLPESDEYRGIPIHRLPLREALGSRDPRTLHDVRRRVRVLLDLHRPDLTHLDFVGPTGLFPLLAGTNGGFPTLLTVQYGPPAETAEESTVTERIVRSADWVAFCSEATRNQWARWLPRPLERQSVVKNAVEVGADPTPVPLDPPHLVCVGRLDREKGYDVAIEALALLGRRFPDAVLTVAGDGDQREALKAVARAHGVEDRVRFPGWVTPSRVPELMKSASVVVVPSRVEAFGLVAAEAAAAGRPVVASRVGGLVEVVEDGRTGCWVTPGDARDLARATERLLEDEDHLGRLGRQAWRTARHKFSWTAHVDAYEKLYRTLTEEPSR